MSETKAMKATLESFKESKRRKAIVEFVKEGISEKRQALIEGPNLEIKGFEEDYIDYSKAALFRHENTFIEYLIEQLKGIKEKEIRELFIEDLTNSKTIREEILAGETNELKLDETDDEYYTIEDLRRRECRWTKCFENLPTKFIDKLQLKINEEEAAEAAQLQQNLDEMSILEQDGVL